MKPHLVLPKDIALYMRQSNHQRILISLPPELYLKLAHTEFVRDTEAKLGLEAAALHALKYKDFPKTSYRKELINAYKTGEPLESTPILYIEGIKTPYSKKLRKYMINVPKYDLKVVGHEGRNRAEIAQELGIKEIPVFLDLYGLKNWPHEYQLAYQEPQIKKRIKRAVIIGNQRFMI